MATLAIGLIAYYMIPNRKLCKKLDILYLSKYSPIYLSAKSTKDNFYLHSDHYVVSCRKCSCYNMLLTKKSSWKAFYDIAKFYEVKKLKECGYSRIVTFLEVLYLALDHNNIHDFMFGAVIQQCQKRVSTVCILENLGMWPYWCNQY